MLRAFGPDLLRGRTVVERHRDAHRQFRRGIGRRHDECIRLVAVKARAVRIAFLGYDPDIATCAGCFYRFAAALLEFPWVFRRIGLWRASARRHKSGKYDCLERFGNHVSSRERPHLSGPI